MTPKIVLPQTQTHCALLWNICLWKSLILTGDYLSRQLSELSQLLWTLLVPLGCLIQQDLSEAGHVSDPPAGFVTAFLPSSPGLCTTSSPFPGISFVGCTGGNKFCLWNPRVFQGRKALCDHQVQPSTSTTTMVTTVSSAAFGCFDPITKVSPLEFRLFHD